MNGGGIGFNSVLVLPIASCQSGVAAFHTTPINPAEGGPRCGPEARATGAPRQRVRPRPFPETSSAFRRTYTGQEIFHSYVAKKRYLDRVVRGERVWRPAP